MGPRGNKWFMSNGVTIGFSRTVSDNKKWGSTPVQFIRGHIAGQVAVLVTMEYGNIMLCVHMVLMLEHWLLEVPV